MLENPHTFLMKTGSKTNLLTLKGKLKMKIPETFAEWCDIFDDFRNRRCDEEILEAASSAEFDDTAVVAEMWAEEFLNAVNDRIKLAQKRFERDMSHIGNSEADIHRALLSLKRELKYIYSFSVIPCTMSSESLKNTGELVISAAKTIESSLADSARNDRSGKLSVIVKNIKLSDIT